MQNIPLNFYLILCIYIEFVFFLQQKSLLQHKYNIYSPKMKMMISKMKACCFEIQNVQKINILPYTWGWKTLPVVGVQRGGWRQKTHHLELTNINNVHKGGVFEMLENKQLTQLELPHMFLFPFFSLWRQQHRDSKRERGCRLPRLSYWNSWQRDMRAEMFCLAFFSKTQSQNEQNRQKHTGRVIKGKSIIIKQEQASWH